MSVVEHMGMTRRTQPSPPPRRSGLRRLLSSTLGLLAAVCLAVPALPAGAQAPAEESDLAYEVLAESTHEPLALDVAPDGRVIWAERDGTINVLTPQGLRVVAAELRPAGNLCASCEPEPDYLARQPNRLGVGGLEEGGLLGILLHRDFAENNLIYTYRSVAGTRTEVAPGLFWGEFHLSTFELDPSTNLIDTASEKVILKVPAEWDHCCHYAGDLDYLPDGTITLTTGDDVDASASGGYGPRDHTAPWLNGELTSANPADRRGKVLRLREDGSVPDGSVKGEVPNPFIGMEGYNPYIKDSRRNVYVGKRAGKPGDGWIRFDPYVYAMGFKQPWRAVVHPKTGALYVSDVGPDAGADDPQRGRAGYEELNRVPFGGGTHQGWPRCIGPNWPYRDVNWETMKVGGKLDCSGGAVVARPLGAKSPVVKGMDGALLYYPSATSERWPIVGSGGKTSEPVAFYPADAKGPLRLPKRYNNRLLMLEWSRSFMLSIGSDPKTDTLNLDNDDMWLVTPPKYSVNPGTSNPQGAVSLQQGRFMSPVDGKVGPDGAFYFLEYGTTFYAGANGRLSRIKCAGCMPADPSLNYGLPVDAAPAGIAGAPGAGRGALPAAAVVTAVVVLGLSAVRRRRLVA